MDTEWWWHQMKHVCLLCRDGLNTWYSICNVSRCTPNSLALTSKTPTASDGEISKMTFLNLQREEEKQKREEVVSSQVRRYSIPSRSATGRSLRHEEDVMAGWWRHSLVGLQFVYGYQHALLVEAGRRVLLRHLLALLGLVVAGFLWQPAGGDRDTCASTLQSSIVNLFRLPAPRLVLSTYNGELAAAR